MREKLLSSSCGNRVRVCLELLKFVSHKVSDFYFFIFGITVNRVEHQDKFIPQILSLSSSSSFFFFEFAHSMLA